jgi:hypothetical protein
MIRNRRRVGVGRRRLRRGRIGGDAASTLLVLDEPDVGNDDVIGLISHAFNQSRPSQPRRLCNLEQRARRVIRYRFVA